MIYALVILTGIWLAILATGFALRRKENRMEHLTPEQRVIVLSVHRASRKNEYLGYDE